MGVAEHWGVADRLHVHHRKPFDVLRRCTAAADIGLSLDRPTVDNFRFSLPNKLFDYLHAGLPVVCSDLPVAGRFVKEEGLGQVAVFSEDETALVQNVASAVLETLSSPPTEDHLSKVAARHHWGAHETKLLGALHWVR